MRIITILTCLITFSMGHSQTTGNPNTGDAYLLFGPNSSWGQYLKVGGNGRGTTNASVVATNGNLHLDSRDGSYSTYINHYSLGNTLINPQGGNVGIGTTTPSGRLEIRSSNSNGIRFNYGNTPSISFLPNDGDSHFHISHTLDNRLTISQGGNVGSGKLLTVMNDGRVGIGTVNPEEKLHVHGTTTIVGDIGVPVSSHWRTGNHTLELQNHDAGDVVLSFHRAGYTNAAIKHSALGGLIFSGSGGYDANHVFLKSNGDFGIGTTSPDSKLTVKGNIHAEEVKVDLSVPGPDYVFKDDYDLKSLVEVQNYIKEHGHLPNIPSANVMETNGIQLGEMNMKLLEKIEELTLYILEQEEKLRKMSQLEEKVIAQENRLKKLEQLLNR